jgi:hypothetical protein
LWQASLQQPFFLKAVDEDPICPVSSANHDYSKLVSKGRLTYLIENIRLSIPRPGPRLGICRMDGLDETPIEQFVDLI